MDDLQDLIERLQVLISKADDITLSHKKLDNRKLCELAIVRSYLDRRLNQIERLSERAA